MGTRLLLRPDPGPGAARLPGKCPRQENVTRGVALQRIRAGFACTESMEAGRTGSRCPDVRDMLVGPLAICLDRGLGSESPVRLERMGLVRLLIRLVRPRQL